MTTAPSSQPTASAPTDKQLQIDVWSDLACPWCYIGKHRLDRAIASSPHAEAITIRVHSYELEPEMSKEAKPNVELLSARYGITQAQARHMEDKVVAMAHSEGLPFVADRVVANSFDVHRLLHLAGVYGLDDHLLGILQRTLFSGEVNAYDPAALVDAATEAGVPRNRAEEVLASDEYADAVRADEEEAQAMGVTGIPFVVLDGRIAIPGATSIKGYADAITQAWSDQ